MLTYLLVLLVCALAGFTAGVASFGFAIVSMLFLPLIIGIKTATLVTLVSSFALYYFILYPAFVKEKATFTPSLIIVPVIGSVIGRYLGATVYTYMTPESLMLSLAVFMVVINLWFFVLADRIQVKPTVAAGITAGLLSGFFGGLNNVTGPPMVAYLHAVEKDRIKYTAHLQLIFLIGGFTSLVVHAFNGNITTDVLQYSLVGVIGVSVGTATGYWMYRKLDHRKSTLVIRYFILFSSIVMILRTLLPYIMN